MEPDPDEEPPKKKHRAGVWSDAQRWGAAPVACVAVGHREDARMLLCWLCAGCVRVTLVYTLWAQREAGRGKIRLTLNLGVTLNSGRRIGVLISG